MRLFVYDMLVNVNVIYYVHVCEQARWARSAGNSAIENLYIIIIISCFVVSYTISDHFTLSGIVSYTEYYNLLLS